MIDWIRKQARNNILIRKFIAYYLAPSGWFDSFIMNGKLDTNWQHRLDLTVACPDNAYINRVANAGKVQKGKQIMHNGLRINLGSYYGPEVAKILLANSGVHEPQEERVFDLVLQQMPEGAVMVELGAFWSFYSMWFQKTVKGARNFMVEPDNFNIGCGKRNFKLNKMKGTFLEAFVGKESGVFEGKPVICVDNIMYNYKLSFIHLLHSDIQGFELDMLQGAQKSITSNKIGYCFISTHTNEIHYQCIEFLRENNFEIISNVDIWQTYSEDGIIVARHKTYPGLMPISVSLKK
ncbi:FkbM family methyltransferase [Runella slithyformis]|uniref:Methyltransferase FkbM family n=1 Tax=Runella slithyformis (strain ATCC 29530 / DSM 19594 / LMG 11500 / NCIMB 11436 / LSU 4) TaxID=761193 RepID=A0A7U4E755_RUNSL|nr:FkbM family methyltransferase [Runella slithyformis]AEI50306.1 methyltransferase FkbM family [Runella slithyformis DSM 19594]